MRSASERYIDLLLEVVNGSVYGPQTYLRPIDPRSAVKRAVAGLVGAAGALPAREVTVPDRAYEQGYDWPADRRNNGLSMIGRQRLVNVRVAVETVIAERVPGDLIETGVWRGGTCALMRGILAALGDVERRVYIADSFRGLPPADASDDAAYLHDDPTLAVSRADVEDAFARLGLLDDQVQFLEGWFADTLPTVADRTWAVVRLDGDQYDSTMDAIRVLYPKLSRGGYLIVDDYGTFDACRRAIHDYRDEHGVTEPIVDIDGSGAYWRKGLTGGVELTEE